MPVLIKFGLRGFELEVPLRLPTSMESTQGWTAGQTGDCIGLIVSSYTESQIIYKFGAGYSHYGQVTSGDAYTLLVRTAKSTGTVAYS